ncbi:MAG: hypothetical protein GX343_03495 [Erysipelotrichaceae bacterium]|jgi:hypothetical protein|nr:hypothetical protein [Bacillota bacterium]MDY0118281.1 hypothetical protein [Bacilli bacterium]NLJ32883.1 hypothetical protein [Erysipelotrichaceae bacterium]
MAKCRNCHSNIDANVKVCPVCGEINPIRTKKVRTVDLTLTLDPLEPEHSTYKPKKKLTASLLFIAVGFTGAAYFYLNDFKKGLSWLVGHVLILLASVVMAYILGGKSAILLTFLITLGVLYVLNIIVGVLFLTKSDLKDGNGEFLQ